MRIAHNLMIDHFRKTKKMQIVKSTPEFNVLDNLSAEELSADELIEKIQLKKYIFGRQIGRYVGSYMYMYVCMYVCMQVCKYVDRQVGIQVCRNVGR